MSLVAWLLEAYEFLDGHINPYTIDEGTGIASVSPRSSIFGFLTFVLTTGRQCSAWRALKGSTEFNYLFKAVKLSSIEY